MHQPKARGKLSPYSAINSNARISNTESTRRHKVIIGIGWRIAVPTLHAYASSGAGNASCYKNHSAETKVDYYITFGQNAVDKETANF